MELSEVELRAVCQSALSPNARALYRALRVDYVERLRSLIMADGLEEAAAIAGRRIPDHPVAQSWTALDDALRELRGRCRGDGGSHDCA